eukprot:1740452-Rhodomonas_salina.3
MRLRRFDFGAPTRLILPCDVAIRRCLVLGHAVLVLGSVVLALRRTVLKDTVAVISEAFSEVFVKRFHAPQVRRLPLFRGAVPPFMEALMSLMEALLS